MTENVHFELSYPVGTVHWDGRLINAVPDAEIDRRLDILQELGVDQLMLAGYTDAEEAAFDMASESARIGKKLAGRGMRPAQHHGVAPTLDKLSAPQQPVIDFLKRQIDYTANLNSPVLVIHPGRMAGRLGSMQDYCNAFLEEVRLHSAKTVMDVEAANLRSAAEYARECNVRIALENVDEPHGSLDELPRLIRLAGSEYLGFCLDSGHAHCLGIDPVRFVNALGDKLLTTHFHDNRGLPKERGVKGDEHLPPGFGTTDWRELIAALADANYAHAVNFESGPWPDMDEKEGFAAAIGYWRTCEFLVNKERSSK